MQGLEMEGIVEFAGGDEAPASGPAVREGVDAGMPVIDLAAMRAELEANRRDKGGAT
jgi:hypothetical protein